MRIDVLLGPEAVTPAPVAGRAVAVIDVLRASVTIAAALAHGARSIVPLASLEDVRERAKNFDRSEVCLAGERAMHPVPGFDLGNSPKDFTREAVDGKTVLLSTTNGTQALVRIRGAREVVVASYVNLSAVAAVLARAAGEGTDITLVCAGRDGQVSLEDSACAGRYVRRLLAMVPAIELGDGAVACSMLDQRYDGQLDRLFAESEHGRALAAAGYTADLEVCRAVDSIPVVPVFADSRVTLAEAATGRAVR
ncbi:MAG TPA: 2-phosphosulfolactate phosphatase [Gemmatimonadaceae bacterium]|nr:2-phosphosulfolactate phosphatase [Gemmatimonadaceae bacterium]